MSHPKPVIKLGALPRAAAAIAAARKMPPCRHVVGRDAVRSSPVLAYLVNHPDIWVWLLHFMKVNGAIEYFPAEQLWKGRAAK